MKNEIRRTQLLNTALEQIARDGWDATTHRSIADACEITAPAVHNHFPRRSDLRDALMALQPDLDLPEVPEQRMKPGDRYRMLLDHALTLSAERGYKNLTMDELAKSAGVSRTLYLPYFGNVGQLRVAVMRAAVKQEVLSVIAQGLAARDPHAMKAPAPLRERAAATLTAIAD